MRSESTDPYSRAPVSGDSLPSFQLQQRGPGLLPACPFCGGEWSTESGLTVAEIFRMDAMHNMACPGYSGTFGSGASRGGPLWRSNMKPLGRIVVGFNSSSYYG
jgi:hypothetical protein